MHEEENEDHLESLLPEGTTVTVERPTPQAFLQLTGFLSWGEGWIGSSLQMKDIIKEMCNEMTVTLTVLSGAKWCDEELEEFSLHQWLSFIY